MAIMFNNHGFDPKPWVAELSTRLPGMDIKVFPQVGDPAQIEYAVIWNHPHGDLDRYPNLKAILLLSAGADFLKQDPSLPADIPIVRLVDEAVARDMAQHCLHFTLHFHRAYHRNARNQPQAKWLRYDYPATEKRRVGILGLGAMGQVVASEIMRAGFPVHAWVRTPRDPGAISLFEGEEQIDAFFAASDILICILPNTAHTQDLINADRLACMPQGAFLINVGRGETIDDAALEYALASGRCLPTTGCGHIPAYSSLRTRRATATHAAGQKKLRPIFCVWSAGKHLIRCLIDSGVIDRSPIHG